MRDSGQAAAQLISPEIPQDYKLRLADFILERVRQGLAGRDRADLTGVTPSRALFAGVLSPLPEASAGQMLGTPAGTSLGLEFRVRPQDSTVRLRIKPKWSVYYPVFPKLEDVIRANNLAATPTPPARPEPVPMSDSSTDESGAIGLESDTPPESDDETPDAEETQSQPKSDIELPRAWRRRDVEVEEFAIDIPDQDISFPAGTSEIARALEQASAAISEDGDGWRHLGDPTTRQRSLKDAPRALTDDVYRETLGRLAGTRVDPPQWTTTLQVDAGQDPTDRGTFRVRVLLVNTTPDQRLGRPARDGDAPDPLLQERALFDAGIAIEIHGAELVPFQFLLAPRDYRTDPVMPAKGINCVAMLVPEPPTRLYTETLPVFRQPVYRTRDALAMEFGTLDISAPQTRLALIGDEMDTHLIAWEEFLQRDAPSRLTPDQIAECQRDRDQFRLETTRYKLGIECLKRDPLLAEAFRLMNRAFGRLATRSGGRVRSWRLFQLGFIVSQLAALAVRELPPSADDEYAKALREAFSEVGVLWFPTGGGKTEAYLGLIATGLLYDRLRGKSRGVHTWMRFPLRMLSLQQLERLARVIAALNELREQDPRVAVGDPFAIGYYVGDGNTPNSVDLRRMKRLEERDDQRNRLRLLRRCPFCSERVEIRPDRQAWRVAHICTNPTCFSNTSSTMGRYRGSLPICIVDNEIYRFLPSVLVGTVDKLAIAGRNRNFMHITRGVRQECPRHGYTSYDECVERGAWSADCKLVRTGLTALATVRDPGLTLLVQDELHLLRDELGVFNGHYEGLLQYLGEKALLQPKVLAATATIEAYDIQAFHIYLSRARRFPQPSWEAGESFYATSRPLTYRRLYAGVLGHTRAIEEAALRVLALYQREVRRLMAAPRRAAEVMGMPSLPDRAVLDALRLYDLSLAYVNRKATGGSLIDKVPAVIDPPLAVEGLGTVQSQLLTGDQTLDDVGAILDRIERERNDTGEARLSLVAATNLISHGVDLERINMMTVCGMPSHYAEYVQATSRAARSHPGLVFVCFRSRDPREASQYEFFTVMHQHLDRLIEAVAVNRFASNAPRKTVPGLLAGVLLHDLSVDLYSAKRVTRPLEHLPTLQTALGMRQAGRTGTVGGSIDIESLRRAIQRIIGVDRTRPPASSTQVVNLRQRIDEVFDEQLSAIRRSMDTRLSDVLQPLTSFRDVDEGIEFGSFSSSGLLDSIGGR